MAAHRKPVRVPCDMLSSTVPTVATSAVNKSDSRSTTAIETTKDILGVIAPLQCVFLVRGRRRCKRFVHVTHGTNDASLLCTEHTAEAMQARKNERDGGGTAEKVAPKPRVSSSQKRMKNPLNVPPLDPQACMQVLHAFHDPTLPLVVDIGSAQGKFLLDFVRKFWDAVVRTRGGGEEGRAAEDVTQDGGEGPRTTDTTGNKENMMHHRYPAEGIDHLVINGTIMEHDLYQHQQHYHDVSHVRPLASDALTATRSPTLLFPLHQCNYLGIELRDWCVASANQTTRPEEASVLQYVTASAHNTLEQILQAMSPRRPLPGGNDGDEEGSVGGGRSRGGLLQGVTIQFPDPWIRAKRKRRRILQPELARLIVDHLVVGGFLYVSTDCPHMALDMENVMALYCGHHANECPESESTTTGIHMGFPYWG